MDTALSQQAAHLSLSRRYREEQLAGLSPVQLLVKIYDAAIAGCTQRDRDRLSRALVELIAALNFEYRDTAVGFFRLYNYCLRQTKAGNFDAIKPILCDLRDAWCQAEKAPAARLPHPADAPV